MIAPIDSSHIVSSVSMSVRKDQLAFKASSKPKQVKKYESSFLDYAKDSDQNYDSDSKSERQGSKMAKRKKPKNKIKVQKDEFNAW